MNQTNKVLSIYGMWFLDMLCVVASYLLATNLRFHGTNDFGNKTLHYMVCVIFLLVMTCYSFFVDWNRDFLIRGYFKELMQIIKCNVILIVTTMVVIFFAQWAYVVSRMVIVYFLLFNTIFMLVVHLVMKKVLHKMLSNDLMVSKVIVLAEKEIMEETIKRLQEGIDVSFQIVGAVYADENPTEGEKILDVPVLAGAENVLEATTQIPFDEVLINTPDISQKKMRKVINGFEEMGVVCHYNLELPDIGEATSKVGYFSDYTVITYTRFKSSYKRLLIKRLVDIIGGLVGLLLTGILTIFIAPAIRIDSKGPVFFSQTRVGKNGRRFKIYKFRSMYQDAEERKKDLAGQNEMSGLMFKMDHDPRITKVGAFLRATSLDEFPQFLNVLKGDMSLVGTRPPTEAEFEQYNEHYRRRISMTPGLTGLWQVSGRSDITDFDEVVKLDLTYIDNWSLSLDFKILLQTVGVVLFSRGAR